VYWVVQEVMGWKVAVTVTAAHVSQQTKVVMAGTGGPVGVAGHWQTSVYSMMCSVSTSTLAWKAAQTEAARAKSGKTSIVVERPTGDRAMFKGTIV
jgi:hypothetical protein